MVATWLLGPRAMANVNTNGKAGRWLRMGRRGTCIPWRVGVTMRVGRTTARAALSVRTHHGGPFNPWH
eukprot:7434147-Karenia_brevis.AAC.1